MSNTYYYVAPNKADFKHDVDRIFTRGRPKPAPGTRFVYVEGPETLTGLTDPRSIIFASDWHKRSDAKALLQRLQLSMEVHPLILGAVAA